VWRQLKRHFLTGLLAVAPLAFTVWVLVKFYQLIAATVQPWLVRIPHLTETYPDFALTAIAFISFVSLIVLAGMVARSLVGVAFFNLVERIVERIPVVKTIFGSTKQIASVFMADKRSAFQDVVLIEYPRPGCFSLAFVTLDVPGHDLLNVFLPTTPNPTSGYMLLVPRDQVVVLPMTVEDGVKLIISGGSVMAAGLTRPLGEAAVRLQAAAGGREEPR